MQRLDPASTRLRSWKMHRTAGFPHGVSEKRCCKASYTGGEGARMHLPFLNFRVSAQDTTFAQRWHRTWIKSGEALRRHRRAILCHRILCCMTYPHICYERQEYSRCLLDNLKTTHAQRGTRLHNLCKQDASRRIFINIWCNTEYHG